VNRISRLALGLALALALGACGRYGPPVRHIEPAEAAAAPAAQPAPAPPNPALEQNPAETHFETFEDEQRNR